MNIETLELIHKLLTEHKDNASRCCDRARGKRNSTPDDDLVCSMSKLLIRAAESNVYSHDTALVRELIKILVAEVFENRENREEEE